MNYYNQALGNKGRSLYDYPNFPPSSFSFPVDHDNTTLTRNLRRTSLTGQTAHPISRQLSGTKVPVEQESDSQDARFYGNERQTSRSAVTIPVEYYPESGQHRNESYRALDVGTSTYPTRRAHIPDGHNSRAYAENENVSRGLANMTLDNRGRGAYEDYLNRQHGLLYDPHKYEEKSINHNRNSRSEKKSPIKERIDVEPQKQSTSTKSQKVALKRSSQDEHEIEINAQDKFIKEKYKLHRFHIIPDGNCLYRAVAQAVLLDQSQHEVLRQLTVEHIGEHKNEFTEIIEEDVDDYLCKASLEGVWAGYPEILAMSRWLDININITTGGSPSSPTISTILHYFPPANAKNDDKKAEISTERQSIWLSWLSSGHYDTLLDKKLDNPVYDTWLKSRESRIKSDAAIANEIYEKDTLNRRNQNRSGQEYAPSDPLKKREEDQPPSYDYATANPTNKISYENLPTESIIDRDINQALYNDIKLSSCQPHKYPAPTYAEKAPTTSRSTKDVAPAPNPDTKHDEELALSLDKEEKEKGFWKDTIKTYYA